MKQSLNWTHVCFITIVLLIFTPYALSSEAENDPNKPIPVSSWLTAGPVELSMPAFADVKNLKDKTFELKNLLEFDNFDITELHPVQGESFKYAPETILTWSVPEIDPNSLVNLACTESDNPQITYLATYIDCQRWLKTKLEIKTSHLCIVYLDGKNIVSKTDSNKSKDDKPAEPGIASKEIELETGKHLVIIKALSDPNNTAPWNLSATISRDKEWTDDDLEISTVSDYYLNLKHLMNSTKISTVSLSPDGELVALGCWKYTDDEGSHESWMQLHRTEDGSLIQTYTGGMKISNIEWAPIGQKFAYTSDNGDKKTLWIVDIQKGTTKALLKDIQHFGSYKWSPDASKIIYSVTEKFESDKTGVVLLKGMEDRQSDYRDRSFLYTVDIDSGSRRRLTAGLLSTNLNDISPDGKILFTNSEPDYKTRPYSKDRFYILDPADMSVELLHESSFSGSGQFSPDGTKLLITAGPELFGDVGINVPEGTIPNDYDKQAYIYDIKTKAVDPITKFFNPAVHSATWSQTQNCVYIKAEDGSYNRLYKYDLGDKTYELINAEVEVMGSLDIARNKPIAVYTGSSVTIPTKAYILDLTNGKSRLLFDPTEKEFEDIILGDVKRWTFTNKNGIEIEGRVYYPPDFDPDNKYPCVVYYYGGTSPTSRSFVGSFSGNFYASNGYVAYILQPSGATGFGQAFSALHVNDWGIIVADEIIDGVKKFLEAHPFVDPKRVGCTGSSYGGFMTMLLQTRTDIFAAAVSHAGISSISSYWGEGYWGYLYSAVSAANSFPWSRKDIFIEQSPLFSADKIHTPLLLLHGDSDTNVPPGESIQLYTALKLLGRDVELVQFEGENHGIGDYKKRVRWIKTRMAWFDKYLKDQPQWWDSLYKKAD